MTNDVTATPAYRQWRRFLEEDSGRCIYRIPAATEDRLHACARQREAHCVIDAQLRLYGCQACGRTHQCLPGGRHPPSTLIALPESHDLVCAFSGQVVGQDAFAESGGTYELEQQARMAPAELLPDDDSLLHMTSRRHHQLAANVYSGGSALRRAEQRAADNAAALSQAARLVGRKRKRDAPSSVVPTAVDDDEEEEDDVRRDREWAQRQFEPLDALCQAFAGLFDAPKDVDQPPPPQQPQQQQQQLAAEKVNVLVRLAVAGVQLMAPPDVASAPATIELGQWLGLRAARVAALLGRALANSSEAAQLMATLLLEVFAADLVATDRSPASTGGGGRMLIWAADQRLVAWSRRPLPPPHRGSAKSYEAMMRTAFAQVRPKLAHKAHGITTELLALVPRYAAWALHAAVLG